jgi:protein-S-isoprenylcysteine O-methyltransferase Ste14
MKKEIIHQFAAIITVAVGLVAAFASQSLSAINGLRLQQSIKVLLFTLVLAVLLFVSSGHIRWIMAWVYIFVYVSGSALTTMIMLHNNPDLLRERSQIKQDAKPWDRVLAPMMAGVCPAATVVVAGLDMRFGRSTPIPIAIQIAAVAVAVCAHILLSWAMVTNSFFSAIVRIQKDRGHSVVSRGPYKYIRHPGYVGILLFALATPAILNSWWAYIPVSFTLCAGIMRTTFEDKTLKEELPGYKNYANEVCYRLLPGVW